jgi:hypothetical protein
MYVRMEIALLEGEYGMGREEKRARQSESGIQRSSFRVSASTTWLRSTKKKKLLGSAPLADFRGFAAQCVRVLLLCDGPGGCVSLNDCVLLSFSGVFCYVFVTVL